VRDVPTARRCIYGAALYLGRGPVRQIMRLTTLGISILFCCLAVAGAAEEWQLRGRVVDDAGRSVMSATVGSFWTSNGSGKRPDGSPVDFQKDADVREFWAHEGEMECRGKSALTADDGSFALSMHSRSHHVLAIDKTRQLGGLVRIQNGQENLPAEIRLGPLVRLKATFEAPADLPAAWTHVYVMLPDDPELPIDNFRIANCGSFQKRFDVALPPGKYVLNAYGQSDAAVNEIDLDINRDLEIELKAGEKVRDLGTIQLHRRPLSGLQQRVADARQQGKWGDYTKHYGQGLPPWHVLDARGVKKDVGLTDFRGKWLLIEFWGFSCPACLGTTLPKLMKFYQEHAAHRDRFEILAFCIDSDNNLQSIADVDRLLIPIVKNVWQGQSLPFPLMLDPTFETAQRYGLRAYGDVLLIDPEGNLVEGDETTLAKALQR